MIPPAALEWLCPVVTGGGSPVTCVVNDGWSPLPLATSTSSFKEPPLLTTLSFSLPGGSLTLLTSLGPVGLGGPFSDTSSS